MRSFRIGSVFGIPIKLDLTFLLVLPLFAYLIGAQTDLWRETLGTTLGVTIDLGPFAQGLFPFALGFVAAVGLFASVLLHELGHSVVAMRYGYPIESITLWLFGGVANLGEMPEDWREELAIAIAGPVVSVGLGAILLVGLFALPSEATAATAALLFVVGYLAVTNVALAVFNLLPGFPMDGGRVLRALLARTRTYARATQIAAEVGKLFAIVLGLSGVFLLNNLFLAGIALFIYIGASSEAQQTMMKAAFEGVRVRDVMTRAERVETVHAEDSVATLLDRMFTERHTGYPVVRDGAIVGMVTLEDARSVREVERDAYRVEEVMTTELVTIGPEEDAMAALAKMQSGGVGRLLVIQGAGDPERADLTTDHGAFVGLVTRTDLMTALDVIRSSGSQGPVNVRRRESDGPDGRLQSDTDRDTLADRHQPDGGDGDADESL
ncbi:site-2 protease family protein [Halomarina oriensis]|uniref:CBS domain-containing protein n=1 Tax=Halomarina oriensis TaxID=671145 RepID=A0A6B0GLB5_9EURY|nr:site-2 protease family protein [Halomarina oriensis]MWG34507.1 CBS domain-containing protein [Halomarina oriensis]